MFAVRINDEITIKQSEIEARILATSHSQCTEDIEIASFREGIGWIPLEEFCHGSNALA